MKIREDVSSISATLSASYALGMEDSRMIFMQYCWRPKSFYSLVVRRFYVLVRISTTNLHKWHDITQSESTKDYFHIKSTRRMGHDHNGVGLQYLIEEQYYTTQLDPVKIPHSNS
jgi:hypothetical protein